MCRAGASGCTRGCRSRRVFIAWVLAAANERTEAVQPMIGQRVRRREDPRFLTGHGRYVDDLELDGALWATFVRSEYAHATITEIDTSELPDGAQVFTAADVDLGAAAADASRDRRAHGPPLDRRRQGAVRRRDHRDRRHRHARDAAVDAAERVWAEMEPLPAVTDEREAIKNETLLFEEAGTNVAMADGPTEPSADLFDGCEVVVEGELNSQRIHVAPIEPRATAAVWENGRLTIWLSTQTPHQDRDALADGARGRARPRARDRARRRRRLRRQGALPEDVLVAWLARKLDRPVRWTETRSEHMVAMGHGRGQRMWFTLGGTRDGALKALLPAAAAGLRRLSRRSARSCRR